jgi:hypothetical protein
MLYPLSYGRMAEWPVQLYKTAAGALAEAMVARQGVREPWIVPPPGAWRKPGRQLSHGPMP